MSNLDINEEKFKNEVIPIFEKIKFSSGEPFLIPPLSDPEEYNYMFYIFFHGAIYKTLLTIKNIDYLSYQEYINLCNRSISKELFNSITTISYFNTPILEISQYQDSETKLFSESIRPLFKQSIDNDIDFLNKLQQEDNKTKDFMEVSDSFSKSEEDINFDFFD